MSLQVWLPLNGNLDNQGLNILPTTPSYTNMTFAQSGKIGKNYGKGRTCWHLNEDILGNQWSIAFWYQDTVGDWSDSNTILFCKNSTDMPNSQIYFSIYNKSKLRISANGAGAGEDSAALFYPYTFVKNTWYHLVATYDGTNLKLYMNGSLVGSKTVTVAKKTGCLNICINGRATNAAGTTTDYGANNGLFNDIRLYDNAISEREVKMLSQALVLHYPLSQGSTNLYDFESIANKWTAAGVTLANYNDDSYGNVLKVTVGSSLTSEHRIYRNVSNIWKSGQVYTVSFLAKASKAVNCTMSRSIANFTTTFTLTTEWKRYVGKITSTATADTGTLSFQVNTTSCDVYITQIKLEYGDIATPYTPGEGDSHYSAMGYDSTTEYDVSGYNNHGTKAGTITYKSDSARYSIAPHFINGSYIMANKNSPDYLPKDSITVNLWIRCTTWGNPISCTEGGGFNFENSNNGVGFVVYLNGVGYKNAYGISVSNLTDGKWHMITGVYDRINQVVNTYLDAQLMKTTATGSSAVIGYASNRLIISGEAQSTTPASSTFVGEESDVRIYAIALSAEDVAELYNTAASLSNNGTLFAYEYVEV